MVMTFNLNEQKFVQIASRLYMRDDTLAMLKLFYVHGRSVADVVTTSGFSVEQVEAAIRRFENARYDLASA